jgi:hypothetical protein
MKAIKGGKVTTKFWENVNSRVVNIFNIPLTLRTNAGCIPYTQATLRWTVPLD